MSKGFGYENPLGRTTEWYTPPEIFEALKIEFDLDPCSPGKDIVPWIPAKTHYTIKDDGLAKPWFGRIWMNPPYGRGVDLWLKKFVEHGNGVALLPVRTDTKGFHRFTAKCDLIRLLEGRIYYIQSDGQRGNRPAHASMLVACGQGCVDALLNYPGGVCIATVKVNVA